MDPEALADAYVREGDALAAGKRYEDAVAVYERAIRVFPDCVEAWTNKAAVLRLQGMLVDARVCIERALEISASPVAESLRDRLVEELRRKGIGGGSPQRG